MDLYQQYIHKSRYARFLPEKNRRESWEETVQRYFDYMKDQVHKIATPMEIKEPVWIDLQNAMLDMQIMPSMRAVMTAGKALDKDNVCGYNCAYLVVDDPKSFDETMYILMCGTGVGFSVERQYVNQMPEIPDQLFQSYTTIIVKDSREGWAKGFRQLISLLYAGEIPKYDLTKLRPAGAILKTMGGRSSGPGPLDELFKFIIRVFQNAKGRKLTSLECHDIMCKIGETVVMGGVRRSAMISLSNLSDDRMRVAKSGAWWEANAQRSLANNSAVYTDKPSIDLFMKEWLALYESKSGERGIFNREASKKQAAKNGRRNSDFEFGTNPCSEIILRPYQFCNLTEVVVRAEDTPVELERKVRLAAILGTIQSTLTYFPYLRKVWQRNTEEERLLGVSLTGIYDNQWLNGQNIGSLPDILEKLKTTAIETNKKYAAKLGIPQSTAVTCVKPSGTVSQLTDAASGIHPRHDPFYYRRVRSDRSDPLAEFMIKAGIPHEVDIMNPNAYVFTFPKKAPKGAVMREDVSALEHLRLWLIYQRHWTEHKPSITVSVKEDEWIDVAAWVYKNFDELSGVSFLPYDGGTYKQAPYESCTEEQYNELLKKIPKSLDWDSLVERTDNVEGAQMLACVAGCEV